MPNPTPDQFRTLIDDLDLSMRAAEEVLQEQGFNINSRSIRHYYAGTRECPIDVYQTLLQMR